MSSVSFTSESLPPSYCPHCGKSPVMMGCHCPTCRRTHIDQCKKKVLTATSPKAEAYRVIAHAPGSMTSVEEINEVDPARKGVRVRIQQANGQAIEIDFDPDLMDWLAVELVKQKVKWADE